MMDIDPLTTGGRSGEDCSQLLAATHKCEDMGCLFDNRGFLMVAASDRIV